MGVQMVALIDRTQYGDMDHTHGGTPCVITSVHNNNDDLAFPEAELFVADGYQDVVQSKSDTVKTRKILSHHFFGRAPPSLFL